MMTHPRRICFVANDYRFFFSHFRPAISAALSRSLSIVAFLPNPLAAISDTVERQIRIVPAPLARESLTLLGLGKQAWWLVKHIRREKPEIVVAFSLKPILALALALPFVRTKKVVFYVTGLGLLELMHDPKARMLRRAAYAILRMASRKENCYFVFENNSDHASMGFRPGYPKRRVLLVGAGVDETEFAPSAFPPPGVFKLATASRLVWSKGIDLAAQAVSELLTEGHAIELSIYGEPDPANPRPLDRQLLANLPGISFKGHTDDVAGIWRHHHAAIFATRGGEGVPRALIEAAACGRPCIVTDVAGCREFIRDGVDGLVVPPNSVESLKDALRKLMSNPECLPVFGQAARERVLQASTSQIIQKQYELLFE